VVLTGSMVYAEGFVKLYMCYTVFWLGI